MTTAEPSFVMSRTAVIHQRDKRGIFYFVVNEDWSKFDGVFMNSGVDEDLEHDIAARMYNEEGEPRVSFISLQQFVSKIPSNPTMNVIETGDVG